MIEDRKRFINEYTEVYKESIKIDPQTLELVDKDKPYIIVNQDEKIHHRSVNTAKQYCQAQPKPKLKIDAEMAIFSIVTTTQHPPIWKSLNLALNNITVKSKVALPS